jgi:hypothetical protein
LRISIIIFAALALSSCFDKGDCLINNTNLIKISLKKKVGNTPLDVAFSSITVEGTAIILYGNKTVNAVELPVDPTKTSMTFLLNYGGIQQKITFSYVNQTTIPSVDCGALVYQTAVTITESTFDPANLRSVNNQLLRNATVNFEILF